MLALTYDGKRGYTANVGAGSVSVLDMLNKKVLTVIPVAKTVQRIALSPDDKWAFTSDQDKPRLAAIETATNQVHWIDLPAISFSTKPTADGKWLLIALPQTNQIAAMDLSDMKVKRTIDVPTYPSEILVRPDAAYISCLNADKIAVIDLASWRVSRIIPAGKGSDGMAWVERP